MRHARLPASEEIALEDVFHALSDPFRLEVVRRLATEGEQSCQALEGDRPKSSVSHHFRVLREAGLIRTRNEGVTRMNALRRDDIEQRFPGLLACVAPRRDD
ncbi:MAG: ArsR/SmtB family transcription factor [Bosea sp. (in: a-proteobacteria)]|uniref:ArsR/SmtB family transcription factor n=1 Tax=unclassified Bosea (in: a-proteobacteria) TaxID=2653178 RepID=UPI000968DE17|nr:MULTISPECIES: helix-turn-helix domain-containing protein [unclassified Bosea (in: a-proteobacteria)]MBN9441278.1 helix-turn-helix transcriptional regulator [Bosea sp. (in: a-proteobacteria)]MBN9455387.1 helix-turn-helix transcriptional regulator [Bosea sp. (in: a-proteobacteria)]OJV04996.1 MAG: transcriptional regulator [Bosea sp. 67-29]